MDTSSSSRAWPPGKKRTHLVRQGGEQRVVGRVDDDRRPAEQFPHRPHPRRVGRERHRHQASRDGAPEHRQEVVAAVGEQEDVTVSRGLGVQEAARHPQRLLVELPMRDGALAAVAAYVHDRLVGSLLRRAGQHVEQRRPTTGPAHQGDRTGDRASVP
ncbi:MAG TPA: hypothetical protein VGR21_04490 [Cryptosporangiaceae bacterium]|nr:hypothetical protein [Cryptosporangiaceae bacterium]